MPKNVEIKARLHDLSHQRVLAQQLSGNEGQQLHQLDVFFGCETGRLKLRTFGDGTGELIYYQRENSLGPKLSQYVISPTNAPETLRDALTRAYGELAVIEKKRLVVIHQRTRIHLDRVRDLGDFLELEVILKDDESIEAGEQEAAALMKTLQIDQSMLVSGAYVDLLLQAGR